MFHSRRAELYGSMKSCIVQSQVQYWLNHCLRNMHVLSWKDKPLQQQPPISSAVAPSWHGTDVTKAQCFHHGIAPSGKHCWHVAPLIRCKHKHAGTTDQTSNMLIWQTSTKKDTTILSCHYNLEQSILLCCELFQQCTLLARGTKT